jgi:hypothetical protein
MQSYVVRVYRGNPDKLDEVAGIIEDVETQHQISFQDLSGFQKSFEYLINSDDSEENQIDRTA